MMRSPKAKRWRKTSAPKKNGNSDLLKDLRQEIVFLNSIIDNIPNMVFLKDAKNLRFVRLNRAGEKILGYKEKELLGKNDYDFFPENEADFFTQKDREVLKKKLILDIPEEPIQTRKRGTRFLHTKKRGLYNIQGQPAFLLGVSEDITEKKEAAARLIESEKRLLLALQVAGPGVWSWQVQKDIINWDSNMFRLFGVKPTANGLVNYQVFLNRLHPLDRKRVDQAVHAALVNASKYNDEYRILMPDKSVRIISVRCMIDRDKKGKAVSMTGVCLDITEQQSKQALEVKSQMISMVSHELRTPIHTVKEGIAVVLEGLTGPVSEEQREVLETTRQCIDRLTRLINNVLNFQKMDAGIAEPDFEKIDLNNIIHSMVEIEKRTAEKKGLTMLTRLCPGKLEAEIDADKIVQVLTNLIHNAIKFTSQGHISISSQKNEAGEILISIEDSGIGFKESEIDRLFTEFGQTETARRYFPQGTGLGLAISKKIIEQHGGKIWAQTKKPSGSIFSFILPTKQNGHIK